MDSDEVQTEGLFYSALARWFFQNPERADSIGRDEVSEAALCWVVEAGAKTL